MRNKLTKYESLNYISIRTKRYLLLEMIGVLAGLTMLLTSCEDKGDRDLTNNNINYGDGVTDIEGYSYKSVIIGDQEWIAENLKTTTYNDGTPITLVEDDTTWSNLTTTMYIQNRRNSSKFNGCSPLQTFVTGDSDALRKPPLAILPSVNFN